MKSAFDTYSKMQDALQSGFSEVRSAAMSPLEAMSNLVQGITSPGRREDASEVEELRQRLADVESRMGKPKRRTKRRKAKR
jgi:hypothetical protein